MCLSVVKDNANRWSNMVLQREREKEIEKDRLTERKRERKVLRVPDSAIL